MSPWKHVRLIQALAFWGLSCGFILTSGWAAWQFAKPGTLVEWGFVPTGELIGAETPPETPVPYKPLPQAEATAPFASLPHVPGAAEATPEGTALMTAVGEQKHLQHSQLAPAAEAMPGDLNEIPRRYQRKPLSRDQLSSSLVQQISFQPPAEDPTGQISDSLTTSLAEVDALLKAGETLKAHKQLSKLYWSEPASRPFFQQRIEATAQVIFEQAEPHFVPAYTIQPGDQLRKIASEHKLSWEYLARLNRIDPRRLQAGKKLKVIRGPFSAHVSLSRFELTVHLQSYFVKKYSVGIGKDRSSPQGKLAVLEKIADPQYTDPVGRVIEGKDPRNPLGPRWLDLGNSYGIHGTIEPESIGKAASRGCIRLQNDDAIEVYDFLVKGSEVVIEP